MSDKNPYEPPSEPRPPKKPVDWTNVAAFIVVVVLVGSLIGLVLYQAIWG